MWDHAISACFVWVGVPLGTEKITKEDEDLPGEMMVDVTHEGWSPFSVIVSIVEGKKVSCK